MSLIAEDNAERLQVLRRAPQGAQLGPCELAQERVVNRRPEVTSKTPTSDTSAVLVVLATWSDHGWRRQAGEGPV